MTDGWRDRPPAITRSGKAITMRLPEITNRIVDVPVRVLRAVFGGVGQLLLVADRLRSEEPGAGQPGAHRPKEDPRASRSGRAAPAAAGSGQVAAQPRWRSLDSTGNVRLLTAEDVTDTPARVSAEAASADRAHPADPADRAHPADPAHPADSAADPADATDGLPLPGYDRFSVPSLRARLRTLDATQLDSLIEYEKAHAGRDEVVTMFERRIVKLGRGAT